MKAYLHSTRLAPKKAMLIADLVRGLPVEQALTALEHTNKKGARIIEKLLRSALANAEGNDRQHRSQLLVKTVVINQGPALQRGVPMSRGRMRPMQKFFSHIAITLGIIGTDEEKKAKNPTKQKSKIKDHSSGSSGSSGSSKSSDSASLSSSSLS